MSKMNQEIKSNILFVLRSLKDMLSSNKLIIADLKKLSNRLMNDITLFHDKDCISLSVLVYALYKIFSKNSDFDRANLKRYISSAISSIDNDAEFRANMRALFDHLKKFDTNLDSTIIQTIKHAQVKRGLKMYEDGLTIGQAAEIMGVSKWEIMEYLGPTNIVDKDPTLRVDSRERLQFARSLFSDPISEEEAGQ